jgi:thiol-disulfide isomerase/thioredoxin
MFSSISVLLLAASILNIPDDLPALTEEALGELIQESRGSVLVVNFWATWCGPCREEFPDFVRLHKERKDQGLTVITVSMDEPEDKEEAVAFLEQQNASFDSYIRGFADFTDFVNAIAPDWSGALPATFIFSREGERTFSRVGETSYEELNREVEAVL